MLKLPSGRSVIEEVVHQCEKTGLPTFVASDTELFGIADFVGDTEDVWQRVVDCAKANAIDIIARVTSDCPLIRPDIVNSVVDAYFIHSAEYAYNHHDYDSNDGDGYDVEVFSLNDLIKYGKDREHVTGNLKQFAKTTKVEPVCGGLSLNTLSDYVKIYEMLK